MSWTHPILQITTKKWREGSWYRTTVLLKNLLVKLRFISPTFRVTCSKKIFEKHILWRFWAIFKDSCFSVRETRKFRYLTWFKKPSIIWIRNVMASRNDWSVEKVGGLLSEAEISNMVNLQLKMCEGSESWFMMSQSLNGWSTYLPDWVVNGGLNHVDLAISGQIIISHQPRFPWKKGVFQSSATFLGAQVVWGRYTLSINTPAPVSVLVCVAQISKPQKWRCYTHRELTAKRTLPFCGKVLYIPGGAGFFPLKIGFKYISFLALLKANIPRSEGNYIAAIGARYYIPTNGRR